MNERKKAKSYTAEFKESAVKLLVIELLPSSINCTEKLPDFVSGKLLPDQRLSISSCRTERSCLGLWDEAGFALRDPKSSTAFRQI
jgi:hypothetical protein